MKRQTGIQTTLFALACGTLIGIPSGCEHAEDPHPTAETDLGADAIQEVSHGDDTLGDAAETSAPELTFHTVDGPRCDFSPPPSPGPDPDAPPPPPPEEPRERYLHYSAAECVLGGKDDTVANATLRIGEDTHALGRVCLGQLVVDSSFATYVGEEPVLQSQAFSGSHFTLAPADGCDPYVTVAVIDSDRYGEPPVTMDLTDTICPGSALHNTTVFVRLDGKSYAPVIGAAGTHHLESFDPNFGAGRGWVEVSLVEIGGSGPPLTARLDYEIMTGRYRNDFFPGYASDLCAPPE